MNHNDYSNVISDSELDHKSAEELADLVLRAVRSLRRRRTAVDEVLRLLKALL